MYSTFVWCSSCCRVEAVQVCTIYQTLPGLDLCHTDHAPTFQNGAIGSIRYNWYRWSICKWYIRWWYIRRYLSVEHMYRHMIVFTYCYSCCHCRDFSGLPFSLRYQYDRMAAGIFYCCYYQYSLLRIVLLTILIIFTYSTPVNSYWKWSCEAGFAYTPFGKAIRQLPACQTSVSHR